MDIIKNSDINFLSSYYTYASNKKDNSIYFTRDEVGSILVNGKIYGQSNYTNISYNKLVNLRNNSALQTGVLYRITDYVTTTSQEDTKSAGIPFDIIVMATSNNTLSEDAKAAHRYSYFLNEKLDSWEIKYCLDNDNTRFEWADTTNGKGVIYYMKDEFNNEAWYDFKNIQFLRTASWFTENPNFPTQFTEDKYFYTFSAVNNSVITDDSLYSTNYHATDNHLGRNTSKITKLNNTIFIDKVNNGVFNNIIADGHSNNTFGQSVWNNRIGHNFSNNIIYKIFQYNNVSPKFTNNKVKDNFAYNEIGAGFTYNELNGAVMRTVFKPIFSGNKLNGSLTCCTFGSNNNYVTDFPSMTNVTIGNQCFNGTDNSKISLNNLFTSNGWNLLTTINGFNTKIEYTILSCDNNRYDIFSHTIFDKISNIYNLGSFETSADAENAAKNTNISSNANYSVLKYYVPSLNKTGIIEQIVGQSSTKQIITWDGVRKVRTLGFLNIGGNISLTQSTKWEELKILTTTEWNSISSNFTDINNKIKEVKENLITPIYSDPNLDFVSTSNNSNCYGYVGSLKNINVNGDLILIDSIAVYVREGMASPNLDTPVWCRLLKFVNNTWEILYQSVESKTIRGIEPETLFSFKMKAINEQNKLIKSTDKIAIVYVDDENATSLSGVQLGFKAIIGIGGGLQNQLSNTSGGASNWAPAFVIGYLSMADTPTIVDTKISKAINGLNSSYTGNDIIVYTYTNGSLSNYSSTPQIIETTGKLTSFTVLSQTTNLVTKEYVDHMHNVLLGDDADRLSKTLDTITEISYWLDNDLNDGKNLTLSLAQLTSKVSYNEKVETTAISNIIDGTIKIKAAERADSLSNISAGNSNTPTYFSNGVPKAISSISNELISTSPGQSTTLQWNKEITLATIAGQAINAKLPANPNTDTKNTAGSTNTNSKIYLIGATSQTTSSQTFSRNTVYVGTDGCLYSDNSKVVTKSEYDQLTSKVSYNEKVETTAISNIIDGTIKIKAAEKADKADSLSSNINIGDSNTPVYFSNGLPVKITKTINNSLISKSAGPSTTLQWNKEITLATIAGQAINAKLPANPNTDTKDTAGSTNTNSKIYLIGATSQTEFSKTFSHDTTYVGTDGCLYSYNHKVITTYEFDRFKNQVSKFSDVVDDELRKLKNALTWK